MGLMKKGGMRRSLVAVVLFVFLQLDPALAAFPGVGDVNGHVNGGQAQCPNFQDLSQECQSSIMSGAKEFVMGCLGASSVRSCSLAIDGGSTRQGCGDITCVDSSILASLLRSVFKGVGGGRRQSAPQLLQADAASSSQTVQHHVEYTSCTPCAVLCSRPLPYPVVLSGCSPSCDHKCGHQCCNANLTKPSDSPGSVVEDPNEVLRTDFSASHAAKNWQDVDLWGFFFYEAHVVTSSVKSCVYRGIALGIVFGVAAMLNTYVIHSVAYVKTVSLQRVYREKRYLCVNSGRPSSYCTPLAVNYAKKWVGKQNYAYRRLIRWVVTTVMVLSGIDSIFTFALCIGLHQPNQDDQPNKYDRIDY